jgi:DNA recombination protein RmuC
VLIATPVTLITLLLTIAHGWRQQALAESIDKIRETGLELYKRLLTMSQHFAKPGDAIEKTVTVGSLERNVLTSARRFRDFCPASAQQLAEVEPIDLTPRPLDSSKWQLLEAPERECAG